MTVAYNVALNRSTNLAYNLGELNGLDGGGNSVGVRYLITDAGDRITTDTGDYIIIG